MLFVLCDFELALVGLLVGCLGFAGCLSLGLCPVCVCCGLLFGLLGWVVFQ